MRYAAKVDRNQTEIAEELPNHSDKQYYLRNRESILQKKKEYYQKHKKSILEKVKAYYQKDKSKILARQKVSFQLKAEKIRERNRNYYRLHSEQIKAYQKDYWRSHPEKISIQHQNRKSRKQNNGGVILESEWLAVLEKYDYACLCCKRTDIALTIDHVIPLSKGGSNTIDNVQPLCKSCNSRKREKIIDYR